MGLFGMIAKGLLKTKEALSQKISEVFAGRQSIGKEDLEELEAILIQADLGHSATEQILESLKDRMETGGPADRQYLQQIISSIVAEKLGPAEAFKETVSKPHVIMVLGVNGTGKTTSCGKLAYMLSKAGNKVLLAAADTFRAAAIEQLEVWAKRSGSEMIRHMEGSDPSAVAYDACAAALNRKSDYLIIDTAGRLHTKSNLMEELRKVHRVIGSKIKDAPHEVLLVMDATTGQNGLAQAREFNKAVSLTGIVLTKLDGTAKGGIVLSVMEELKVPVRYVGIGEGAEDLRPFDPEEFSSGLF